MVRSLVWAVARTPAQKVATTVCVFLQLLAAMRFQLYSVSPDDGCHSSVSPLLFQTLRRAG